MRKFVIFFAGMLCCNLIFAQQVEEKYSYVTADFQSVLILTMTTESEVDFTFNSIESYKSGRTKYNAVKLEVDATTSWDLFAYANSDHWNQVDAYSAKGEAQLPAEILEVQVQSPNESSPSGGTFNTFTSLKGLSNSGVVGGLPNTSTQFLAGMVGTGAGESYSPGAAKANSDTHTFRVHYRIIPGDGSRFPNSTVPVPGAGFAQAGAYSLEVVFALVEDL